VNEEIDLINSNIYMRASLYFDSAHWAVIDYSRASLACRVTTLKDCIFLSNHAYWTFQ